MNRNFFLSMTFFMGLLALTASCNQKTTQTTAAVGDSISSSTEHRDVMTPHMADSTYLLGVWYDEDIQTPDGAKIAYQVVTNGSRVFIQPIAFKGEKLQVSDQPVISPTASELKKTDNKYVSIENPDDSYEVDGTGNLLIYHNQELVVTCKKIL